MSTTVAEAPTSTITTSTHDSTWAVLDRTGNVVVLFGGGEAEAEARQWRARGYRIARLAD
ncbi:MAG: hypothetical protein M3394_07195 [Actinomycetota bacterium]|nr:hypothetical protein [Actinomycetota bacterium]